ncbi:DNA polymerase I [Cryomorphaceae bacterium]|nr:DNA polymerase I [Cryomorphaceae bacterium]
MAETSEKRLFLLDAYALIYRSYFAFSKNPRMTSDGRNTSAIYGFMLTLLDLIRKEDPSHIAIVFDPPGPVDRVNDFAEYKANREETPEDIKMSVPIIKDLAAAFRIPCLQVMGFEADDVIGTLAKKGEQAGYQVYMMTPDKDYGQLVSDNIFMYKPAYMGKGVEVWGIEEVKKRFEIERVDQVIDFLGMMGDAVDNIPGIPGVGQKTAQKFIAQYGSMEGLYENLDDLKGKMKEKVEQNRELAFLSKKLATIITDVPIEFDEKDLIREEPDEPQVRELFEQLEFRSLVKRVFGDDSAGASAPSSTPSAPAKAAPATDQMDLFGAPTSASGREAQEAEFKTLENTPHDYELVDSPEKRKTLISALLDQKSVCFDTETTGIDPNLAELVGLAFSYEVGKAYYVPVPDDRDEALKVTAEFKDFFENEGIEKVGQNLKYDINVLKWHGVEVRGAVWDTMLAHYLLNPDMRHNMDLLAQTYLNYQPVSIESLIGKKGKKQGSMRDVAVDRVAEYAGEDADITLQLKEVFEKDLGANNVERLFRDLETPLVRVLAAMETEGVRLDSENLAQYSSELKTELQGIQSRIYDLAGAEFNIGSPKQLGEILFEQMKIVDKPKKTKSGQYSTSEDTLSKLAGEHEIIDQVLDYRSVSKLISTYVDALPELVNPKTGRIHTTYNQTVAATGRLSSNNPNLQNIPIRTERGRKVRAAFVPRDENHVLLAADYSQIELRLIAALAKDEDMIAAFKSGQDIHKATAAKVYGVPLEEVDRDMRSSAKMVNFGIIYGISAFGLADRLNIKRTEAREIIDNYFSKYPAIKEYMDYSINFARELGYVQTIMERRRYLPDINSRNATVRGFAERNAINAPIQGSAADIIKKAMIAIHDRFQAEGFKSKMILQVHDELVFDAHIDELETIKPIVRDLMENAVTLDVPLLVDMGTGQTWLEAH